MIYLIKNLFGRQKISCSEIVSDDLWKLKRRRRHPCFSRYHWRPRFIRSLKYSTHLFLLNMFDKEIMKHGQIKSVRKSFFHQVENHGLEIKARPFFRISQKCLELCDKFLSFSGDNFFYYRSMFSKVQQEHCSHVFMWLYVTLSSLNDKSNDANKLSLSMTQEQRGYCGQWLFLLTDPMVSLSRLLTEFANELGAGQRINGQTQTERINIGKGR